MNFFEWLHYTPEWKASLDDLHYTVYKELNITRERLEEIFEKLESEGFFETYKKAIEK